jgi:tRNA nucleotidyltransferase/poly(A) polymerase
MEWQYGSHDTNGKTYLQNRFTFYSNEHIMELMKHGANMHTTILNQDLMTLRQAFLDAGRDIRLVGGVVRDLIMGQTPKDIDLCTDATPDEQHAIYMNAGLQYVDTGIDHGTITVVMNGEGYEITSLRTESQHDGRHAVVAFTRDWTEDLSRRDLTINAISMTFDGEIHDPFGGVQDIENNVVRFVGNPQERMTEDYLRIMRYFRFLGRMAGERDEDYDRYLDIKIDPVTVNAIYQCVDGLAGVSAERIWVELKKIVAHPSAFVVLTHMKRLGVFSPARIPYSLDPDEVHDAGVGVGINDPIVILASCLDKSAVRKISTDLKWSSEEVKWALEFQRMREHTAEDLFREVILNGTRTDHASKVARLNGYHYVATLLTQPLPVCPVNGATLAARGMKPGPEMGKALRDVKVRWYESGCSMTAEDLMNG